MSASSLVVITGASRGIGAAVARELAEPGRTILLNFRSSSQAAEIVRQDVRAKGAKCEMAPGDATDPKVVAALFERANGLGSMDVLVVNAGIPFQFKRLAQILPEEFEAQWRSQAYSAFLCCRHALPLMAGPQPRHVVFILSAVTLGQPPAAMAHYVSAKYALLGLAKSLAMETTDKGLAVHLISPGMTETEFISGFPKPVVEMVKAQSPGRRLLQPDETARLVGRLVREETASKDPPNHPVSAA